MHAPPGFGAAAADHRLVRRVRGSDAFRRAASATRRTRAAFSARPSIRRRFIGSPRCGGCWPKTASRRRGFRPTSTALQRQLLDTTGATALGAAELLNPLDGGPHARFLAFRSPRRAALVCRSSRRRIASPTCAATCCGSASGFTRTRATSTGWSSCLGDSREGPADQPRGAAHRSSSRCCCVAYIFNYLDRQILGILAGPIIAELHLTDTPVRRCSAGRPSPSSIRCSAFLSPSSPTGPAEAG